MRKRNENKVARLIVPNTDDSWKRASHVDVVGLLVEITTIIPNALHLYPPFLYSSLLLQFLSLFLIDYKNTN